MSGLETAKAISDNAQKLFIGTLAACLYSWLAIATTTDINLISNRTSSPLPVIQPTIPIVGFYYVASLLLLELFFYFHFYLQKLWEEMGSLPAVFPDGRPLQEKANPWLMTDIVRAHVAILRPSRPFLAHLQQWISILLGWFVVPLTMLMFWVNYLRRHDKLGTALHCAEAALSLTAAVALYWLAARTLRGEARPPFMLRNALRYATARKFSAVSLASAGVFALLSLGAIQGVRPGVPGRDWWPAPSAAPLQWTLTGQPVLALLRSVGVSPFARLGGADLSTHQVAKPASSSSAESLGGSPAGLNLSGADLRYADLRSALLEGAVLTGAHLDWADLLSAHLSRAAFAGAHLDNADLLAADLHNADLTGATLTKANLRQADLKDAELQFADLNDAQGLNTADLQKAGNWCNAFYDPGTATNLGLPTNNANRIKDWLKIHAERIAAWRGAAEAARLEQLSRLFPGIQSVCGRGFRSPSRSHVRVQFGAAV